MTFETLSIIFLILFAAVAAVDGIYYHLLKYRLFERKESIFEHRLHTVRAFLFIPIVYLLFYGDFSGLLLWAGLIFVGADLIVELVDVFSENDSRAGIGGLTSAEYAAHVTATTFRIAALSFAIAAKPLAAWSLTGEVAVYETSQFAQFIALNVIIGNLAVGLLHVALMFEPIRRYSLPKCCA
jgi:hypothetical protein